MERIRKMRAKKKMELKSLISDKIMDIVKKLENNIQNKPSSVDDEGKSKEIPYFTYSYPPLAKKFHQKEQKG